MEILEREISKRGVLCISAVKSFFAKSKIIEAVRHVLSPKDSSVRLKE